MIAYKIEIVIDEEHEENFEEIMKNIYDHIERIPGITEVHGDPDSYFEYNEDFDYVDEDTEMTDEEVVSKEYITVDEALKLWANGKIVYCEINGGVYTYDYARTQEKGFVAVEDGLALSPEEITKGKFYTKERTK